MKGYEAKFSAENVFSPHLFEMFLCADLHVKTLVISNKILLIGLQLGFAARTECSWVCIVDTRQILSNMEAELLSLLVLQCIISNLLNLYKKL